jgi:phage antirepressor YoqD-like protein
MNELIKVGEHTHDGITSLDLKKQINLFRGQEGNRTQLKHSDLLKVIRDEFEEEIGMGKISYTLYKHPQNGQEYPMFELTLSQAKQVLVRESKFVRKAVISYIEKLEKTLMNNQPNLPQTYKEALKELLIQVEENERLQLENKDMKPKAEYFDEIVDRGGLTNFRGTAKLLGVSEKAFIFFLIDKKYIYRDQKGTLKPVAKYVGTFFELKEWVRGEKTGTQTLVTVKGKDHFLELINRIKH